MNNYSEWRDITGYENVYQVSNEGQVRSLNRMDSKGRRVRGRNLAFSLGKNGYFHTCLCQNGKVNTHSVHRLVAKTFLGSRNNYLDVNHIDGNKQNNCVSNLEWVTKKDNMAHALKMGLFENPRGGKFHPCFKGFTVAVNIQTGEQIVMEGAADIKAHGFTRQNVYACLGGKLEKHKGHTFYRQEVITNEIL